ncbi:hypothetical protein MUP77_11630, partial [Candidatus Bathyarchaeota archaeon]|nr:hypothetical protein [Candidatus Bathyarchaeota archaeon]
EITLTAKTAPRYARGVIAKRGKEFIVCGIGFVAEIRTKNAHFIKAERGHWNKDKYRYIGRPKPNTVKIGTDRIMIEMDDDDLSSLDVFRIDEKQYCIRVYVR